MTNDPSARKPTEAARHPFGPRPIGAVLPAVTRPAFRTGGALTARLLADWSDIVGASLAASTMPRGLRAGTLTLGCAGPIALELQHLAPQLMARINGHLGQQAVQRLRFVQEPALTRPAPRPARPTPATPVTIEAFPAGPLRDALAALGGAVRAERA